MGRIPYQSVKSIVDSVSKWVASGTTHDILPNVRRGSQVVRQGPAKPSSVGSIPSRASLTAETQRAQSSEDIFHLSDLRVLCVSAVYYRSHQTGCRTQGAKGEVCKTFIGGSSPPGTFFIPITSPIDPSRKQG